MPVDLSTTYAGVPLKNPLMVGGGPNTATPKICEKAAKAGWAGVSLKLNASPDIIAETMPTPDTVWRVPRPAYKLVDYTGVSEWRPNIPKVRGQRETGKRAGIVEPKDYQLVYWNQNTVKGKYMMYSAIGTFYNGPRYLWYVNETKKRCEPYGCKVFANVTAYKLEGWQQQVEMVNKSNADGVEVVIACPGYGCWDERVSRVRTFPSLDVFPEIIEKATKFFVNNCNKPVSVKLPPDYMYLMSPIVSAVKGGAKGIQFGDCPTISSGITPLIVDPDTLQVGVFPGMPWAGAMTQCNVVPYICGAMAKARMNGVGLDLAGCGGVRDYKDVIRILLSGATSVQVVTAVMVEGVGIVGDYLTQMNIWMEQKGYKSVKEMSGRILRDDRLKIDETKFVAEVAQASGGPAPSLRVTLTEKKCINCGWCEQACPEMAINIPDKKPVIDRKVCEVCGLCVAVCPMKALAIESAA